MKNPLKKANELFGEEVSNKYVDLGIVLEEKNDDSDNTVIQVLSRLNDKYLKKFGKDYEDRDFYDYIIEKNCLRKLRFEVSGNELRLSAAYYASDGEINILYYNDQYLHFKKKYLVKNSNGEVHKRNTITGLLGLLFDEMMEVDTKY